MKNRQVDLLQPLLQKFPDIREEELNEQLSVAKEMLDRAERLLDSSGIGVTPAEKEEVVTT